MRLLALNALKNAAFTRIAIKLQLTLESCCTINLVLTIFFLHFAKNVVYKNKQFIDIY